MTNLIETPDTPDPSLAFDKMSERIKLNAEQGFGGAVVIYAPDGAVVSFLLLDDKQDLVQFWTLVQSKAQMAIAELGDQQTDPFGRRR